MNYTASLRCIMDRDIIPDQYQLSLLSDCNQPIFHGLFMLVTSNRDSLFSTQIESNRPRNATIKRINPWFGCKAYQTKVEIFGDGLSRLRMCKIGIG